MHSLSLLTNFLLTNVPHGLPISTCLSLKSCCLYLYSWISTTSLKSGPPPLILLLPSLRDNYIEIVSCAWKSTLDWYTSYPILRKMPLKWMMVTGKSHHSLRSYLQFYAMSQKVDIDEICVFSRVGTDVGVIILTGLKNDTSRPSVWMILELVIWIVLNVPRNNLETS